MRILIYCGTRRAALDVHCHIEGSLLLASLDDLETVLPRWEGSPDSILVVAGHGLITVGYNLPTDTHILFDQTFPDDPALRTQALARAGRRVVRGQGSGATGDLTR